MVSPSGTLLVDSLNGPSRPKHTPLWKSIHTSFVFFTLSVLRVCVLMDCVSLLWRKMMRTIILDSYCRRRFLFPWGIPAFCKKHWSRFYCGLVKWIACVTTAFIFPLEPKLNNIWTELPSTNITLSVWGTDWVIWNVIHTVVMSVTARKLCLFNIATRAYSILCLAFLNSFTYNVFLFFF